MVQCATNAQTREVFLHGELGRKYGKHHRFAVASAAEAVRALAANFPGFEQHLTKSTDRGVAYQVWAGGENIGEERLRDHSSGRIYISPVVMGSKRAGTLQTIVGAVLIVIGVILLFTPAAAAGPFLIKAGALLFLGGIAQMLTSTPNQDKSKQLASAFFDGPVNTAAQGGCVPVGYGHLIVGSATISAGISIDDQARPVGGVSGGGGTGNGNWSGSGPSGPIKVTD
ncbi:MAG: tail assembly protein [Gammaproteobacteria bacterium]